MGQLADVGDDGGHGEGQDVARRALGILREGGQEHPKLS